MSPQPYLGWLDALRVTVEQMDEQSKELRQLADDLGGMCERIKNGTTRVGAASSGSWIGYQADLYYGDFEPPPTAYDIEWGGRPDGWSERRYDEVLAVVEDEAGTTVEAMQDRAADYRRGVGQLRTAISVALAPAADHDAFADIAAETQQIEDRKWGPTGAQILQGWQPTGVMTRDSSAVTRNFQPPAHQRIDAAVEEARRSIASGEQWLTDGHTLLLKVVHRLEASRTFGEMDTYKRWRWLIAALDFAFRPLTWMARRTPGSLVERLEQHPAVRLLLLIGGLIGAIVGIWVALAAVA